MAVDNNTGSVYYNLDFSHEQLEALLDKINEGYVLSQEQYDKLSKILEMGLSTFSGDYEDLINKPEIPELISELENDLQFQTADQLNEKMVVLLNTILEYDYADKQYVNDADAALKDVITEQIEKINTEHTEHITNLYDEKISKKEGFGLAEIAEMERLAEIHNYDDSELRELIDEEKPYLADVAAYPTSKFLFACGQPMTVEPNTGHKYDAKKSEDAVAFVYRWAEGFEAIVVEKEEAAKVYLVGGYGYDRINVKRPIPQTNMLVKNVKIKGLVGGSYFEGMVGHVNMEAENCEFVSVMGAGWCGASVNGQATRMNIADDINVKMTNCKISSTFFGGSQGNGVADDVHVEFNNCEIGWLTAGGSNGMTRNAEVVMNGGSVKVVQSTNRGIVHKAKFIMNDGVVEKLYFGGETEDTSVNGLIEDGFVELNGGKVKQFCFGTDNGIEITAEKIKGCIMNCVVENGDISMLETKVEEPKVDIDLSEYAKVSYVDEQIAAIELIEGPMGLQGEKGEDGYTPVKGVDYFTEEEINVINNFIKSEDNKVKNEIQVSLDLKADKEDIPNLEGLATEQFVQDQIINKVDKVEGKDLIDVAEIERLSKVDNFDDSELRNRIQTLEEKGVEVDFTKYEDRIATLEAELKQTRQHLADLTFGIDYEWVYYYKQDSVSNQLGFNEENAPKFFEDYNNNMENDAWWISFIEDDIYRLYAVRLSDDPKYSNKYDTLIPFEGNMLQEKGEELIGWNPVPGQGSSDWTWNFDDSVRLNLTATSPMVFALLKVKKY